MTSVPLVYMEDGRGPALLAEQILARGLLYGVSATWVGEPPKEPLTSLGDLLLYEEGDDGSQSLHTSALGVMRLSARHGQVYAEAHGATLAAARELVQMIRGEVPETPVSDDELRVAFWALGPRGPSASRRVLAAPTWAQVRGNYAARTAEAMERLVTARFAADAGGKLLLWSGDPGTGKSYALRALAQEWRRWADVQYIVDPEKFFGDAAYMQGVLLGGSQDYCDETPAVGPAATRPKPEPKWRLVVLEDTGELLSADAKERVGQGLSRLLNLCDGLIGQGLRVLVLITTNEDIRTLHPAVKRPGRCAANVHFDALSAHEARAWLDAQGVQAPDAKGRTLAELYELTGSTTQVTTARHSHAPLGLGMPA